jgi:MOSC domain-containing protein YiiM
MGTVEHIFVAQDRGEPMVSLGEVEALADCGLRGDRYAHQANRKSSGYQLTLIERENIEAFALASGLPLAPHEPRRNLVTVGVRLNELCGVRFSVGEAELEGIELCEPCSLFAKRTHPEVVRFFVHRGGLRCRIVRGGQIRVGDDVVMGRARVELRRD